MSHEYEYVDPAGSTLEDFLDDLGIREEVYGAALKEVLAWQLEQARDAQHISKSEMASRMGTSRPQVDVTREIGEITSKILLREFAHTGSASNHHIEWLLHRFAQRNVTAALELAGKGLRDRMETSPDGRIDIREAIRIVRELDYEDNDRKED